MTSFDTTQLVERGQSLQVDVHTFAEQLSNASRLAINATNPALAGTELGDEWPLTFDLTIEDRLTGMVAAKPRAVGKVAVAGEESTSIPEMFIEDKIRNDALAEAYGSEEPRHAFTLDLLGWLGKMEQAGWSVLARVNVSDLGRIELGLYEDNDSTRSYFDRLVDRGRLTEADIAEGAEPYTYLGERVVVDDPRFAAEVLAKQK
jgi:hypothetical protein